MYNFYIQISWESRLSKIGVGMINRPGQGPETSSVERVGRPTAGGISDIGEYSVFQRRVKDLNIQHHTKKKKVNCHIYLVSIEDM